MSTVKHNERTLMILFQFETSLFSMTSMLSIIPLSFEYCSDENNKSTVDVFVFVIDKGTHVHDVCVIEF